MKTFITVLALVVAIQALTDEQKAKIKQYHKDCLVETGVSMDVVNKARGGEFLDDPKLKEHLFCFAKKAGFQDENGNILKEKLQKTLNEELKDLDVTNKLIELCAVPKATPQETAFESIKCYFTNTPAHIVLN